MPIPPTEPPDAAALSRRGFLRIGFGLSAAIACAGLIPALSGCSPARKQPAAGMRFLRETDVALFTALLPAVVAELAARDAATRQLHLEQALGNVDATCAAMEANARAELRKLLDLLAIGPLRRVLGGVGQDWRQTDPAQARHFLARWRASRFATLNAGAVVLVKLCSVGYYLLPAAWPGSGYPGPNPAVYRALHANASSASQHA
ncbi:hypothetical protein P3W85_17300 [Cupriavidus basilensis]|uniref:Gluconate 2-dehydrogenase subunit 3 family protein n=1 Tax=Cupriavidus basilensis TaxID=68895 RepID=A0ABT6AQZ2_9BURK|nr:hypothetical protein [Cupriavidus basilensis]MDF3834702.1 hypothetical protein [Cupriavidus basilensis]